MPRFQQPNPLDLMFFAIDEAWRRCGLGGAEIHLHLEFAATIDADGLRRAMDGLHRLYPATNARLHRNPITGAPRWMLDTPGPGGDRAVRVEDCRAQSGRAERRAEQLLSTRIDLKRDPPLRFHILQRPEDGDLVVMRWPHALMDARGGVTILETLADLYDRDPGPDRLQSLGDEHRTDFGTLNGTGLADQCRSFFDRRERRPQPRVWHDIRLCSTTYDRRRERMRLFVRRLAPDAFARVREASVRVCGIARFADFLRACAVRAMHEVARSDGLTGDGYSTMHLIDNRRRRDPGPVCHNVFSTLPLFIPADIAHDRRAVADRIQAEVAGSLTTDRLERRLAGLRMLGRFPNYLLASAMARGLQSGRSPLPLGLSNAPSLPMGFMGPLSRPRREFFNAELVNIYGVRPASPRAGFAINVNTAQDRLNLAGVYFEPRVERGTLERLLDRFEHALTETA